MNSLNDAALSGLPALSALRQDHALPHVDEVIHLFSSLRKPLLRYVSTFGIDIGDGEEIVQEAFLALFKHLQLGQSSNGFKSQNLQAQNLQAHNLQAWTFRVCHNLALKLRGQSRHVHNTDQLDTFIDDSPDPEQQLLQSQRQRKLQSVLGALSEQDRCCICLRAEGLRYRQIAEVLDISLGAVSISLTRSLAKFERADKE